ncbi:hypothetical protein B296_00050295 [Ensete ventricosum]|uniref:Uncharacterized protein n=1 Tax=Ensete ventricosum TaxID=4639 RepID=A0A426XF20_ENSVE|nr:hypothetical protein B296_00050295 [Ensete ventricosum]
MLCPQVPPPRAPLAIASDLVAGACPQATAPIGDSPGCHCMGLGHRWPPLQAPRAACGHSCKKPGCSRPSLQATWPQPAALVGALAERSPVCKQLACRWLPPFLLPSLRKCNQNV